MELKSYEEASAYTDTVFTGVVPNFCTLQNFKRSNSYHIESGHRISLFS